MFTQLRRAIANRTTTVAKRQFGAHHEKEYMSTHSELPANDWRNKPMSWDFYKEPTSQYEEFVQANLEGPNDPALKLTKGQFIVYMRRLAREQYGYDLYTQRLFMAFGLATFVCATNTHYLNARDPKEFNPTQIDYRTMFDIPSTLRGDHFKATNSFRLRMDDFFKDHDEETIAKLPKDLQDLYYKEKDEYNETYASQGDLIVTRPQLSPDAVKAKRDAVLNDNKLTALELYSIIVSCDTDVLYQQALGIDTIEEVHASLPFTAAYEEVKKSLQLTEVPNGGISDVGREAITGVYGV
jgi:hypothetical protein